MRWILADIALRTGIPQHALAARFTIDEIRELFAIRKMDFETRSKEDVRAQMMTYKICHAIRGAMGGQKAVSGMKPESYGFSWKPDAHLQNQTQEQIRDSFLALRGVWRMQGE